jgi:hypothetical protein
VRCSTSVGVAESLGNVGVSKTGVGVVVVAGEVVIPVVHDNSNDFDRIVQ